MLSIYFVYITYYIGEYAFSMLIHTKWTSKHERQLEKYNLIC